MGSNNNELNSKSALNDVNLNLIINKMNDVFDKVMLNKKCIEPRDLALIATNTALKLSPIHEPIAKNSILWNEINGYNLSSKTKEEITILNQKVKNLCINKPEIEKIDNVDNAKIGYKTDARFNTAGIETFVYDSTQKTYNNKCVGVNEVTFEFSIKDLYNIFKKHHLDGKILNEIEEEEYKDVFNKIDISPCIIHQLKIEIIKFFLKDKKDEEIKTFLERLDNFSYAYYNKYITRKDRYGFTTLIDSLPVIAELKPEHAIAQKITDDEYERTINIKFKLNGKYLPQNKDSKKPSKYIEKCINDCNTTGKFTEKDKTKFTKIYRVFRYLQYGSFVEAKDGMDSKTIEEQEMNNFKIDEALYDKIANIIDEKIKNNINTSDSFYLYWSEKILDEDINTLKTESYQDGYNKVYMYNYINTINKDKLKTNTSNYDKDCLIQIKYSINSVNYSCSDNKSFSGIEIDTLRGTELAQIYATTFAFNYYDRPINRNINSTEDWFNKYYRYSSINGILEQNDKTEGIKDINEYISLVNQDINNANKKKINFRNLASNFSHTIERKQNIFFNINTVDFNSTLNALNSYENSNNIKANIIYHICMTLLITMYINEMFLKENKIIYITKIFSESESIANGLYSLKSTGIDSSNFHYALISALEKVMHKNNAFVISQGYTETTDKNKKNNGLKSSLLKMPKEIKMNDVDGYNLSLIKDTAIIYITSRESDRNGKTKMYIKCSEGYKFIEKDNKIYVEYISGSEDCILNESLWNIEKDSDLFLLFKKLEEEGIKNIIYILDASYDASTAIANKNSYVGLDKEMFKYLEGCFNLNFIPLYNSEYQVASTPTSTIITNMQNRFMTDKGEDDKSMLVPILALEIGSGGLNNDNFAYKNGRLYKVPYNYYYGNTGEMINKLLDKDSDVNKQVLLSLMFLHYITNEKVGNNHGINYGKNYPFAELKERIMKSCVVSYDLNNHEEAMMDGSANTIKINYIALVKAIYDVINKKEINDEGTGV